MPAGILGQIGDDQIVVKQLLSYCDFNSIVAVGQTCRQLKHCSDEILDNMADIVISHKIDNQHIVYANSDDKTIAGGIMMVKIMMQSQ